MNEGFSQTEIQRRRDDNKNKICGFEGGALGAERKNRPNGEMTINIKFVVLRPRENKILKMQILLSRNFVVMAQAPRNVSSVVLESGNVSGAFPQTATPTLDKIPGPMDARFLSSVGLGFGTRIGRTQHFPTPVLDKNRFPSFGKEFYRKGKSVKRSGPFSEPPDSENQSFLRSSPSQILAPRILVQGEILYPSPPSILWSEGIFEWSAVVHVEVVELPWCPSFGVPELPFVTK